MRGREMTTTFMRPASLPRPEAENHFAELDAVAVGERPLDRVVHDPLVVDDDGIGSRQVLHRPPAIRVCESRVAAAHRVGMERDRLRRPAGFASEDQLGRLARRANETNLAVLWLAGENLEAARENLDRLFARSQ